MKTNLAIVVIIGFMMSGCSSLGFGENQTYCQEHGRNFKDAGVCGDTYEIYKNIGKVRKISYKEYDEQGKCVDCEKNIKIEKKDLSDVTERKNRRTR